MKLCPTCNRCYEDQIAVCEQKKHKPLIAQRVGTQIIADKYRLESLLGHGGTGAVYRCKHLALNQAQAIKLLRADFARNDPNGRLRLRREALTSCNFAHPNLVRLLDFGTHKVPINKNGHTEFYEELYIVMELVEGQTLKDYLAQKRQLTFGEAIEIASQILAGLAEVHSNGVVHRDLKPANIMLTHDRSGNLVVKILDFGSVKLIGQSPTLQLPDPELTGQMFIGSPKYSSPESCLLKPLDGRSDIYCLGLIVYEMLAGCGPYEAPPNFLGWLSAHAQVTPRPLHGVPQELADLIMRTLSKLPEDRHQSATELRRELNQIKKSLGSAVLQTTALPSNVAQDGEDEVTRVATSRPDRVASTADHRTRVQPHKNLAPARTIVGIISMVVSLMMSVVLTLTFVRNSFSDSADEEKAPSASQRPSSENATNEFFTSTDVNIRTKPSGLSEKVGLAEKGSRVRVLEKYKNWRRIVVLSHGRDKEDPNSQDEGWIDGDNLSEVVDLKN